MGYFEWVQDRAKEVKHQRKKQTMGFLESEDPILVEKRIAENETMERWHRELDDDEV